MLESLFFCIEIIISRQVIGLATTIAYYSHLHQLLDPNIKIYQVMVGDLKYTGNILNLVSSSYWKELSENIYTKGRKSVGRNRVIKKFFQYYFGRSLDLPIVTWRRGGRENVGICIILVQFGVKHRRKWI